MTLRRAGDIETKRGWAWLGWSLVYLLLQTVTPFVRVPIGWVWIGTLVSTLALMASMLGLVFTLARACEARRWLAAALLSGGATAFIVWLLLPTWLGVSSSHRFPPSIAVPYRAIHGYLLILTAIGLGCLMSRLIREKNLLVPVVPFAALVDAITVMTPVGFVKRVMESAPAVVERATVAVMTAPTSAPTVERVVPIVLMGVGDFVFLALYAACLYRFALRAFATAIGLFFVLWAYLVIVMLGVANALPALVPMAVVVLAVNWREFRLTRQELWASLLVVGATATLLLWLLLGRR
ncbi:hypothetical protein HRbin15_00114 [bacterium HR15]|uniref:Uncharacterized protein n=1 Tax=uncultured prokaryote TaxID=198431 RepID=H5SN77_9ZZZZ|nr:hypothetical protein HGMM_F51E10C25 [uncultured prokaryote]GBC91660.1 hypothetical protein HRbin15_00114 [bacterium HR15]